MPPINKPSKMFGTAAKMTGDRPVKYPRYQCKIHCNSFDGEEYDGALNYEAVKELLGWETESEYTARMLKENPDTKEGKWKYNDTFLLKNELGEKVRCRNNSRNRPFDEHHAKSLKQDQLELHWEVNGETIIIGRTGLVLSGQHRLIGFMLAVEEWRKTRLSHKSKTKGHWETNWPNEPVLECTVFYGVKEDPRVIRTLDNVRTRTLTDTIYTSPIFDKLEESQRRECSKMMDSAVDLLWKRTKQKTGWSEYQTHSSSLEFLEKHPKLKPCVKHIFDCNRNRVVTLLRLSAGQCAGMMYLMGSSGSDVDNYYYPESPKKESQLNWDNWDKALAFWSNLVDSKNDEFDILRVALSNLQTDLEHLLDGNKPPEKVKQILLSKAWNLFVNDEPITKEGLDLSENIVYSELKGRALIAEETTVGGIDCGVVQGNAEQDEILPSAEEVGAEKAKQKQNGLAKMKDKPEVVQEENDENVMQTYTPPKKKGQPVFSEEERKQLLAKMQPKSIPAKKPTLAPKK